MSLFERLAAAAGRWAGTSTLQDPKTGAPLASPSTLTVTPVLGGRFVRVDSTWDYLGDPQDGSLLVGFDPADGRATAHWVDTWHTGRTPIAFVGGADGGAISVLGTYAAPPGPDWGWRIAIVPGERLRITHTNIDPDGRESPAVDAVYSRLVARGTFDVKLEPIGTPDKAEGSTLGTLSIAKVFRGDLEGASRGAMYSALTDVKGSAGYVALERVEGTLHGRAGSFVLQHSGTLTRGTPGLTVHVVPDSATGALAGLDGRLAIRVADGVHSYEFDYTLPDTGPAGEAPPA